MSRKAIIDFLLEQREYLLDNNLIYATICFFEKNYQTSILELDKKIDDAYIYHTNAKQVYDKKYSFSKIESTILGLFFGTKDIIKLKYSDLEKGYLDPYYLKDITNIKFNTLHIVPIYEEEILGYALFYFKKEVVETVDLNKKLLNLMKKINNDELENVNNIINNLILKKETYYIIACSNNNITSTYWVNNPLMDYLKLDKNVFIPTSNLVIKKINKIQKHKLTTKVNIDQYTFWYLRKDDLKGLSSDNEILTLDNISTYDTKNDFSLIYFYHEDQNFDLLILEINKLFINLFPSNMIKFYQVTKTSLIIIIDTIISNSEELEIIKEIKNQQIVFINSKKHSLKGMNLINIINYLEEIKPTEYKKEEYLEYFRRQNEVSKNSDLEYLEKIHCYQVVNNINHNIGTLITLPPKGLYTQSMYEKYQSSLEKNLNKMIDKYPNLIITILSSSFKKKKTFEMIKKLLDKNKNLYVIIHQNNNSSLMIGEGIVKLRNMNVKVIIDSSIYMNLSLAHYTDIVEGIYLKEEEYDELIKYPNLLGKQIIDYFINLEKIVIIEKAKVDIFTVNNCYYLKK